MELRKGSFPWKRRFKPGLQILDAGLEETGPIWIPYQEPASPCLRSPLTRKHTCTHTHTRKQTHTHADCNRHAFPLDVRFKLVCQAHTEAHTQAWGNKIMRMKSKPYRHHHSVRSHGGLAGACPWSPLILHFLLAHSYASDLHKNCC
jgi:hypothetical protein